MKKTIKYLKELVQRPSPTGMTHQVENYLLDWAKTQGISVVHTAKGAVVFSFNASKGFQNTNSLPLILTAHVDTLGAMVKKIDKDSVELVPIGGYPPIYLLGNNCTIHGSEHIFLGTILPKNPAVHVNDKLKDLAPKFEDLSVRIDHLTEDDFQLSSLITTGDFISLDPEFSITEGFIKSRHLDDKASAAVLLRLAENLKDQKLTRDVHIYFNVTEETGQGLAGLPEKADLLVVDMGVVGNDCQGKETHVSICAKDSSGPYNYSFIKKLKGLAESKKINYVVDIFPFYGSDGSGVLQSGKDYRVALIGPGVSASHGWERTHTKALEQTLKLLSAYIGI